MFKVSDQQAINGQAEKAERNYVIQKNDRLELEVYTNQGERLIDPNNYIDQDNPGASGAGAGAEKKKANTYLINEEGILKLPMIAPIKLEGLTIMQAEELLQKEYAKYYQQPFVVLRYTNKRVVVLGAPGGQVIPLANENMRLTEVLALARGINNDARASNIRILRGDTLFVADLTTFEGYKKNNILIKPGDIVYVEPIRRPISEALRDYGPVLSVITSLTTLIVVLISL
ncbi:polysaccharide biosynthesis/export family protein [Ohtaekwangia sp.]|uniref:polysaccharide biosynthesis/export family protein n=1 Tax=Ohtaekwangia sp. TaxID=2066019 RepID=UPI002FDE1011